jgi:quaternary ammonium compound-resistance protein SugE
MAWTILVAGGLFEVVWAVGLKQAAGRAAPLALTFAAMALSIGCLAVALRTLPVGTAYAVWTGIGAAGTAVYGMAVMGEPRDLVRLSCIGLIVAASVGLKLFSPHP